MRGRGVAVVPQDFRYRSTTYHKVGVRVLMRTLRSTERPDVVPKANPTVT